MAPDYCNGLDGDADEGGRDNEDGRGRPPSHQSSALPVCSLGVLAGALGLAGYSYGIEPRMLKTERLVSLYRRCRRISMGSPSGCWLICIWGR